MSYLELEGISKTYRGAKSPCVNNLYLSAERGEIVAVLGESGCGKTTLLKLIAKLEQADSGIVRIDGEDMSHLAAEKRPLAMVFQKALLFGNMTVEQNVNFAPRMNHSMGRAELRERTEKMLALVHMSGMGKRRVTELSGGQEQRVSLARALMINPKVLLLDEPLSALDANLKLSMEEMIRDLNRQLHTTMLYVTHDQAEACAVADRIALMHNGIIRQFDRPEVFFRRPADRYTAEFFGWQNFLPAEKIGEQLNCALGNFAVPKSGLEDGQAFICIRPEAMCNIGGGSLHGRVLNACPQTLDVRCVLDCGGLSLTLLARNIAPPAIGDTLSFDLDPNAVWPVPYEQV